MRNFADVVRLFVALLTLMAPRPQALGQAVADLSDSSYAVLSAYFRTQLTGKNSWDDIRVGRPGSVVAPMTMRWRVPLATHDRKWLKRDLKGIQDATITSFETCADSSVPVSSRFSLPTPYIIATEDDISSVAKLYAKYPKTWGFVSFSCVGINEEQTQALFFVERDKYRCGVGKFVFMEKNRSGEWQFKADLVRWIS
jgi:hypothetical protein